MKIAYIRYNQNTDLDYAVSSVGSRGSDVRLGVLEALIELGHEVTIVSWIPATHRHALKGESKGCYDNTWMTSLKWDMKADMQSFDLLFVETAAANTMFSFNDKDNIAGYGGMTSFVLHFSNILYDAQGIPVLIYHHGNKHSAFPFSRLSVAYTKSTSDEELSKLSKNNYQVIFKGFDIWDGYNYTVWHHAVDNQTFQKIYATQYDRTEMQMDKINFVSAPIGYSSRYDLKLDPRDPLDVNMFDLVYVGRCEKDRKPVDGGRYARMKSIYDSPRYNALLVGRGWDEVEWKYKNVTAPGQSKYHGDVFEHYAKGLACVQIVGNEFAYSGLTTTRLIQAIRYGCVTMGYHDIVGIDKWVGEEFIIRNQEDVFNILDICCDTKAHVQEVVEYQRTLIPTWSESLSYVLDQI